MENEKKINVWKSHAWKMKIWQKVMELGFFINVYRISFKKNVLIIYILLTHNDTGSPPICKILYMQKVRNPRHPVLLSIVPLL